MLGLAPLPRTLRAALRDVTHAKLEVRRSALADLVRHARAGEAEACAALTRVLGADTAAELRAEAALGLADADVRSAVDALVKAAETDSVVRVRQLALLAVGELADASHPSAARALEKAWRDGEAAVRFQALLGLHQLGLPEAEAAIVEGTVDPDAEIRRLSYRIAEAHFGAVGALPELVRARARQSLDDANAGVRAAAALCLGHFGERSAEGILVALAAGAHPGAALEDEQQAMHLVGELSLGAAAAALSRRAFGWLRRDPLAFEARVALARLGDARAASSILDELSALSFRKRTLAAAAAGRARLEAARPALLALAERPDRAEAAVVREALDRLDGRLPKV